MNKEKLAAMVQDVIDGHESGLKVFAELKDQKNFIDECLKEIEGAALDEASKYGSKSFEAHGLNFELRAGGRMWNFKSCPNWVKKQEELKEEEELLKAAHQAYERGATSVDANGEVYTLPEVTYRKDSIVIKGS